MNRFAKSISCVLFLSTLFAVGSKAQTINAASCSAADVQAALNSVTTSGTTVKVPAGNCTWASGVKLTTSLSVTVMGASTVATSDSHGNPASFNDNTVITDGFGGPLLNLGTAGNNTSQLVRVSGITIKATSQSTYELSLGSGGQVRIDHCHFIGLNPDARVWSYGVADHNLHDANGNMVANAFQVFTDSQNNGNVAWNSPTQFGTANFFFIENNTFNDGFGNDCNEGGRYVARYNTFHGTLQNGATLQFHATGAVQTPPWRGCRAWEIYNNWVTSTYSGGAFAFSQNFSGTGVQYNNTVTGQNHDLFILNDRDQKQTNYTQVAPPLGWGYCGTYQTGVGSPWDGNANLNGSNGSPCIDQPGRGQGDMLQGFFPSVCDLTAGLCALSNFLGSWPHQYLEPIYLWNDTWTCPGCSSSPSQISISSPENNIVMNRDVYADTGASCAQNATTCSSGVGVGTLAQRPSNCTAGPGGTYYTSPTGSYGVGWWATDQNTLYACSSTNNWTAIYTPYTYPHPLAQGTGTSSNVAPPSNLTAVVQ